MNQWSFPTQMSFGAGALAQLPDLCQQLAIDNPLLVTDPGLAQLAMMGHAQSILKSSGRSVTVFCDLKPNPVGRDVEAGVRAYNQGTHDGVIAMGGGSALDVGKAIALMVGQERPLWDFEDRDDWFTRVNVAAMAPVIALPTTAGTGSEVGRSSVIIDEETHTKKIIFHPAMMPARVLCDPELTFSLPAGLTAATGMDALSHNLEAYCTTGLHPMADGIAVEGMRLIFAALHTAVVCGDDLLARSQMMIASSMGATAFQKGLGSMHAMSHPLSSLYDTHHGLANAIVMPYVLMFNRSAIEERIVRLACYLQLPDPSFEGFVQAVCKLRSSIGIPHTLGEIGIKAEHIPQLAAMAAVDANAAGNPITMSPTQFEELYQQALTGDLPTYGSQHRPEST